MRTFNINWIAAFCCCWVFSGSSATHASEVETDLVGGYRLTESQKEMARKLAAEANNLLPGAERQNAVVRPKARPSGLNRSSRLSSNEPVEVSIGSSYVLSPPARLIGKGRDIPLRQRPSNSAMIVKLVREQIVQSELIVGDWYLVIVSAEPLYVHRDEVVPAPR